MSQLNGADIDCTCTQKEEILTHLEMLCKWTLHLQKEIIKAITGVVSAEYSTDSLRLGFLYLEFKTRKFQSFRLYHLLKASIVPVWDSLGITDGLCQWMQQGGTLLQHSEIQEFYMALSHADFVWSFYKKNLHFPAENL